MDAQEDASPTTIIDASPASAPERQPAQGIAQIAPRLESSYTVIRSRVPYDARIWTPKEDRAFKTLAALKTDLPLNLDVLAGGLKFELFQGRNRVDAVVPLDSEDDFQATMRGFNAHIRKWMRVYQGTDKTIVIDMTIEQLSDIGEAKLEDEDDTQYALPFGSPNRGS
jgi:hypothetical protein